MFSYFILCISVEPDIYMPMHVLWNVPDYLGKVGANAAFSYWFILQHVHQFVVYVQ